MIDFEEIRKQVAIEHNNLLGPDDPILMSVTMNELVFRRYVDILFDKTLEQNEAYRKSIDAALQKGIADAKVTAGRVITEGSNYANDRMREAVKGTMDEYVVQIKKDLTKAWHEIQAVKKVAVASALVSCFCTIVTLVVAINVI